MNKENVNIREYLLSNTSEYSYVSRETDTSQIFFDDGVNAKQKLNTISTHSQKGFIHECHGFRLKSGQPQIRKTGIWNSIDLGSEQVTEYKNHLSSHQNDGVAHINASDVARWDNVANDSTYHTVVIGTATSGHTSFRVDYLCSGQNDATIINSAIQSLKVRGGKIVLLEGTYFLGSQILVNVNNLTIEGVGRGVVFQREFAATTQSNLLQIQSASRTTISNLQIRSGSNKSSYNSTCAIDAKNSTNINLIDLSIEDHHLTISGNSLKNVIVQNLNCNPSIENTNDLINLSIQNSEFIWISNSIFKNSTSLKRNYINLTSCKFVNVMNNSFEEPYSVRAHLCDHTAVCNNIFFGSSKAVNAIDLADCTESTVSSNSISNYAIGINSASCMNIIITRNTIAEVNHALYDSKSTKLNFLNNDVRRASTRCCYLSNSEGTVSGNILHGTVGVRSYQANAKITNNSIASTGAAGVQVVKGDLMAVNSNVIKSAGAGISFTTDPVKCTINGNYIESTEMPVNLIGEKHLVVGNIMSSNTAVTLKCNSSLVNQNIVRKTIVNSGTSNTLSNNKVVSTI